MARFTDYIKFIDADDGAPEGAGSIFLQIIVEGFGTDGNYGRGQVPILELEATGERESKGLITLPTLSIEAYSGTHAHLSIPFLSLEVTRDHSGNAVVYIPNFAFIANGGEAPPLGGFIDLPNIYVTARGGPLTKVYQLCNNENYGL